MQLKCRKTANLISVECLYVGCIHSEILGRKGKGSENFKTKLLMKNLFLPNFQSFDTSRHQLQLTVNAYADNSYGIYISIAVMTFLSTI